MLKAGEFYNVQNITLLIKSTFAEVATKQFTRSAVMKKTVTAE